MLKGDKTITHDTKTFRFSEGKVSYYPHNRVTITQNNVTLVCFEKTFYFTKLGRLVYPNKYNASAYKLYDKGMKELGCGSQGKK